MKIGKLIGLVIVLLVAWNLFKSFNSISIPLEKMKQIAESVDRASYGKAQVNWKNVASIAAVEFDNESFSTVQIEKITNLFLDKKGDRFYVKDIEEVSEALHFSTKQREQVNAYKKYLDEEGIFTARMSENSMNKNFIDSIENAAIENYKKTGVLPSITIAQAILESDWGRSQLAKQYNNLFGIKAHNWNGETANLNTSEYYNKMIKDDFRVYDSVAESITDHGVFLSENPRYKKHGVFSSKTYMEQAVALQEAGYSTVENANGEKIYSELLEQLIQQYQLQLIDSDVHLKTLS